MNVRPLWRRAAVLAAAWLLGACSSTTVGVGIYGGVGFYDDPWYYGGCCIDPPVGGIGPPPPRPEHPIADRPPVRPSQPIAMPPRPMPAPRPAAMPRGRR